MKTCEKNKKIKSQSKFGLIFGKCVGGCLGGVYCSQTGTHFYWFDVRRQGDQKRKEIAVLN